MAQKDLLSRLADRGENVIGQITDLPGAHAVTEAFGNVKDRLDDLTKRVRGIEGLDKRVADLERRLDELAGGAPTKRSATRSAAPKKTGAAVKKSATTKASSKPKSKPAPSK